MHDTSCRIVAASSCNVAAFFANDRARTGNDAGKSATHAVRTRTIAPFWGAGGALNAIDAASNGSNAACRRPGRNKTNHRGARAGQSLWRRGSNAGDGVDFP
jgi:hypothetical protein